MPEQQPVFGGKGTHLFAGIPVTDLQASLAWYNRLFGSPPAFFPNDREAVWTLAEHRWFYIIVDPKRAGGTVLTVMVDGLDEVIGDISRRGLEFGHEERPADTVRKVMYYDPDGNEIGVGSIPSG